MFKRFARELRFIQEVSQRTLIAVILKGLIMKFQIATFYKFVDLSERDLSGLRAAIRSLMAEHSVLGTLILANEGFNSTVCGEPENVSGFISELEVLFGVAINFKSSFSDEAPFVRAKVKIKPEIVTLRKTVNIEAGVGTHVAPEDWNAVISRPDVVLLDARNHYEYASGTFMGSINPETETFSELPRFVDENLDAKRDKSVAMFCTGGIRCEKFAPYLKTLGFENVFQLEGGILKYLEVVPHDQQLWEGECYVFDKRVSVDQRLQKGNLPDKSLSAPGDAE